MGLKLLIFSSQGWLPWQPTQVFSIVYIQWNTTQPQKRNEIVLSVTTWITPENIILSHVKPYEYLAFDVEKSFSNVLIMAHAWERPA